MHVPDWGQKLTVPLHQKPLTTHGQSLPKCKSRPQCELTWLPVRLSLPLPSLRS